MLKIENLSANAGDKAILQGLNLNVRPGVVHAIMGPNGAGKSTLANVLSGRDGYEIISGQVTFNDADLLSMSPEARAHAGLFLAFQYPVAIPGVTNINFLKASLNANRIARGESPLDAIDFLSLIRREISNLQMDESFLYRALNEDFSGGEKKRNEILQMRLLQPKLAILDETDSGLDIDALKIVAEGVNQMRDGKRSFVVITHYQRLLDYIEPDFVHVLAQGTIVKSGDKSLALELEQQGYSGIETTLG